MQMETAALTRHRDALDAATATIRLVRPADLRRPTPCTGWDLRALLEHMVGQNHGFAAAVEGSADHAAFAPRALDEHGIAAAWEASAARVAEAFAAAPAERDVRLVEISEERPYPAATALGFHLLDTVVHTWDVAVALGRDFRPDAEVAVIVHGAAAAVPAGPARERPGAAFAPPLALPAVDGDDTDDTDPWIAALALLGRRERARASSTPDAVAPENSRRRRTPGADL